MAIIKHVADTRHHTRFITTNLKAVILGAEYLVENISLAGALIALGDDVEKINLDKKLNIMLLSSDFGEDNYLSLEVEILEASYETGLLRIGFFDLPLSKREILRNLLESYKNLQHPNVELMNKLFSVDFMAEEEIKNQTQHEAKKNDLVNSLYMLLFAVSVVLFISSVAINFNNKSKASFVPVNSKHIVMPFEGRAELLVSFPEDKYFIEVSLGQKLVNIIGGVSSKKTLQSTCDCYLVKAGGLDIKSDGLLAEGQPLFYLASKTSRVVVDAIIHSKNLPLMYKGMGVQLGVDGGSKRLPARIVGIKYNYNSGREEALVRAVPNEELPFNFVGRESRIYLTPGK